MDSRPNCRIPQTAKRSSAYETAMLSSSDGISSVHLKILILFYSLLVLSDSNISLNESHDQLPDCLIFQIVSVKLQDNTESE
jgi:hypothetical protein